MWGRPNPLDRLWPPPSTGSLLGGSWCQIGRCWGWIGQFGQVCGPSLFVWRSVGYFVHFVLRLSSVLALFRVWVPAIQESPKLVEMISNKPYIYFWCLNVMKRCRSWQLYFWLKGRQHILCSRLVDLLGVYKIFFLSSIQLVQNL
jgi:hypothetical protein